MAIPQCPHLCPIKNYQKAQKQMVFAGSYLAKPLNVLNRYIQAKIHKVYLQIIFNHFSLVKANPIFLWVLVNKSLLISAILLPH